MTTARITLVQSYLGVDMYNVFDYFRLMDDFTLADLNRMVDDFENNVLPALNDVQADDCLNVELRATRLDVNNVNTVVSLTGGGTVVTASTGLEPTWFAIGEKLEVGSSFDTATGDLINQGRGIRRGYKFFGGIPEDQISNGVFDSTVRATEWAALRNAMLLPVYKDTFNSIAFEPIVLGVALPATSTKPARPACGAFVTAVTQRDATSLRSRKS